MPWYVVRIPQTIYNVFLVEAEDADDASHLANETGSFLGEADYDPDLGTEVHGPWETQEEAEASPHTHVDS